MRNKFVEHDHGSYIHEEEVIGLHVSMGNSKTNSNGRKGKHESVTMKIMQREAHSYREDNETIMKVEE
jgi:hypothetical protein